MPKYEPKRVRFARFIRVDQRTGCWNWLGGKCKDGYGYFNMHRETAKAHRASYTMFKGPIGEYHVLHKCHNRACVNPNHLYLGTHNDNMRDLRISGRRKVRCKK